MTNTELREAFRKRRDHGNKSGFQALEMTAKENGLTLHETLRRIEEAGEHGRSFGGLKRRVARAVALGQDPDPVLASKTREGLEGYAVMYSRIVELNREKQALTAEYREKLDGINRELDRIRATLKNGLELIASGDVPEKMTGEGVAAEAEPLE